MLTGSPFNLTTKMLASRFRVASQLRRSVVTRSVTTLSNNPDIVGAAVSHAPCCDAENDGLHK